MRQFRGKIVKDEKWVYGSLVRDEKGRPFIIGCVVESCEEYIGLEWWEPVRPSSVGQATGLKDKKGAEIYEGDIIKSNKGLIVSVYWLKEDAVFSCRNSKINFRANWTLGHFWTDGVKVIGNITDNPDLVKEEA